MFRATCRATRAGAACFAERDFEPVFLFRLRITHLLPSFRDLFRSQSANFCNSNENCTHAAEST